MLMFAVCFYLASGDSIWQDFTSNVIQQFEQTGIILSPWWAPQRPASLFDLFFRVQTDAESRWRCPEIVWAQSFPYHPAFQPLAAFMRKGSWRGVTIFHLFWATMCNSKGTFPKHMRSLLLRMRMQELVRKTCVWMFLCKIHDSSVSSHFSDGNVAWFFFSRHISTNTYTELIINETH